MGADAGFDMVPRLSRTSADRKSWKQFMNHIKTHYEGDAIVAIKSNYIEFNVGKHPKLPFEGHKFLRFSSKITGKHAAEVEPYLEVVSHIAQQHFGSRLKHWNELVEHWEHYCWPEVIEAEESYAQKDEADSSENVPVEESNTDYGEDPMSSLFVIMNIKGRGSGLIAGVDIPRGTRILCEQPLICATRPTSMLPLELEMMYAAKLHELPKSSQWQFLSLYNSHKGKFPFSNIFQANALPCGPDSVVGAVYPTICLINHSCIPNAHNNWNDDAKHDTVYANRDIKAGEEITIAYILEGISTGRRASLRDAFGFDCTCSLCTRSVSEVVNSDARRAQIRKLDNVIGDPMNLMQFPKKKPRNVSHVTPTVISGV